MNDADVFLYSVDDLVSISKAFAAELSLSASGSKTSLSFLVTDLPRFPLIRKHHARYQAMVIGGTYFQQAIVNRSPEGIRLENFIRSTLPDFSKADDFFNYIVDKIDEETQVVTINLAYELQPVTRDEILDGILLDGGKENDFQDLLGKQIGVELESIAREKLKRNVTIAVANDTLCLGLAKQNRFNRNEYLTGIVGTGYNLAMFVAEDKFVNIEAGEFHDFRQTDTGETIDQNSEMPGDARYEKEVAGAYLYQHYNLLIDQIGEDAPHAASTDDLTIFATAGDRPHHQIARKLIERSASLVAAQIAGIYQFKKQPKLTFVMEGSLFWHGWRYKELVAEYLVKLGIKDGTIHFSHIKDSSLLGSANLALINAPHIHIPEVEKEEEDEEEEEKPAVEHGSADGQAPPETHH